MKRLIVRLEHIMNDFNLKKKLHILYIYCMLIPLIITDSVILFIVVQSERVEQRHVMENDASAVIYNLSREVENAAMKAKNIYMNEYIEEFLNRQYETPLDYVTGHQEFMKNSLFETSMGTDRAVGADEPGDGPRGDPHGQVVDRRDPAEAHGHVLHVEQQSVLSEGGHARFLREKKSKMASQVISRIPMMPSRR